MNSYKRYCDYIKSIIGKLGSHDFKRHPDFQYMLEHLEVAKAMKYESLILNEFGDFVISNKKFISELISKNDSIGNPIKGNFPFFGECSPSNIRYLFHALLSANHMKKYDVKNIVEIGGGYGGLCFYLFNICRLFDIPIESYTMIDLEDPVRLQEKYLNKIGDFNDKVVFLNNNNYDSHLNENYFLVSTYSIGEIEQGERNKYKKNLLPKCSHGFVVWNVLQEPDLDKVLKIVPARPTSFKFLYF